jgi:hypothetical protein
MLENHISNLRIFCYIAKGYCSWEEKGRESKNIIPLAQIVNEEDAEDDRQVNDLNRSMHTFNDAILVTRNITSSILTITSDKFP